jgi:hypothetical protein
MGRARCCGVVGLQYVRFQTHGQLTHAQLPTVSSIEAYQGKESPVVIISCVRSAEYEEIRNDIGRHLGFLKQPQRLNVAISRPRAALVIVGNANTLMLDPEWKRIITLLWDQYSVFNYHMARIPAVHPARYVPRGESLLANEASDETRATTEEVQYRHADA